MSATSVQETTEAVDAFLGSVELKRRREDAFVLKEMMARLTDWPARMCGKTIVGFGSYKYLYKNGKEASALVVGFSPRKAASVLYIMDGFSGYADLLSKLGKYKTGKCCLYINKLDDVDLSVLEQLITKSVEYMKNKYGC